MLIWTFFLPLEFILKIRPHFQLHPAYVMCNCRSWEMHPGSAWFRWCDCLEFCHVAPWDAGELRYPGCTIFSIKLQNTDFKPVPGLHVMVRRYCIIIFLQISQNWGFIKHIKFILTLCQELSLLHSVQIGSGAHPGTHTMGTGGYFPGDKAAGAWSWRFTSN
jgi:hypothetical protein